MPKKESTRNFNSWEENSSATPVRDRTLDLPITSPALHQLSYIPASPSPRADLHVVGMLRFMSDTNQPSLPTPFYSVLVSVFVFMALSTVLYSINSPDNSPFSHSVLVVLALPYWSFQLNMSLYESFLQP